MNKSWVQVDKDFFTIRDGVKYKCNLKLETYQNFACTYKHVLILYVYKIKKLKPKPKNWFLLLFWDGSEKWEYYHSISFDRFHTIYGEPIEDRSFEKIIYNKTFYEENFVSKLVTRCLYNKITDNENAKKENEMLKKIKHKSIIS